MLYLYYVLPCNTTQLILVNSAKTTSRSSPIRYLTTHKLISVTCNSVHLKMVGELRQVCEQYLCQGTLNVKVRLRLGQVRYIQTHVKRDKFQLGQVRLRQVRLGLDRLGQVRLGQVRLGQVRLGQVRLGQVRLGQVRLGQVMKIER